MFFVRSEMLGHGQSNSVSLLRMHQPSSKSIRFVGLDEQKELAKTMRTERRKVKKRQKKMEAAKEKQTKAELKAFLEYVKSPEGGEILLLPVYESIQKDDDFKSVEVLLQTLDEWAKESYLFLLISAWKTRAIEKELYRPTPEESSAAAAPTAPAPAAAVGDTKDDTESVQSKDSSELFDGVYSTSAGSNSDPFEGLDSQSNADTSKNDAVSNESSTLLGEAISVGGTSRISLQSFEQELLNKISTLLNFIEEPVKEEFRSCTTNTAGEESVAKIEKEALGLLSSAFLNESHKQNIKEVLGELEKFSIIYKARLLEHALEINLSLESLESASGSTAPTG